MPSCSTEAADGMVVATQSARIRSTRKMCLELLASEHTGDCYGHCHVTCPAGIDIPQFSDITDGPLLYGRIIARLKDLSDGR